MGFESLDGRARSDISQLDLLVAAATDQEVVVLVDVEAKHAAVVAVEGPDDLAGVEISVLESFVLRCCEKIRHGC